jgi:hypothetical protein
MKLTRGKSDSKVILGSVPFEPDGFLNAETNPIKSGYPMLGSRIPIKPVMMKPFTYLANRKGNRCDEFKFIELSKNS